MPDKCYNIIGLIVAAGCGDRFSSKFPKQYDILLKKYIISYSIETFLKHPNIDALKIVIHSDYIELYNDIVKDMNLLPYSIGGNTRHNSILNGLQDLEQYNPEIVLIHDASRPLVSKQIISNLIKEMDLGRDCVVPVLKVNDSLKKINNYLIADSINRENIVRTQTPQAIRFSKEILKYYKECSTYNDVTDDADVFRRCGKNVYVIDGSETNLKITYKEDIKLAEAVLLGENYCEDSYHYRVGSGFDAHKFDEKEGDNYIIMGGIKIPHPHKLLAHSDGDVLIHSVVDALLGAIGAGDIGEYFPPSDLKWKNADSAIFLKYAGDLIKSKSGYIVNIDVTIICEKPRMLEYKPAIRSNIAKILNIDETFINIKATTTEGMGFTGRKEGIAVQAVVMIKQILKR